MFIILLPLLYLHPLLPCVRCKQKMFFFIALLCESVYVSVYFVCKSRTLGQGVKRYRDLDARSSSQPSLDGTDTGSVDP